MFLRELSNAKDFTHAINHLVLVCFTSTAGLFRLTSLEGAVANAYFQLVHGDSSSLLVLLVVPDPVVEPPIWLMINQQLVICKQVVYQQLHLLSYHH